MPPGSPAVVPSFSAGVIPLNVQAWVNLTGEGGGGSTCIGRTGQVGSTSVWTNVSLVAVISGGAPPYGVQWQFGDGSANATYARVNHTYTGFGTWYPTVTVTDAAGDLNTTRLTYLVPVTPGPLRICSPSGTFDWEFYALVGGIVGMLVTGLVLQLARRRPSGGPPSKVPQ